MPDIATLNLLSSFFKIYFSFFISFPNWYTFIFFFYIYSFSLHVSDRLVHHQENQMFIYTCSLWHRSLSRWCVVRGRWCYRIYRVYKESINDARSAKYKDIYFSDRASSYSSCTWPSWRTIPSITCLFESSTCCEQLCAHLQEDNCINTTSGIITLC